MPTLQGGFTNRRRNHGTQTRKKLAKDVSLAQVPETPNLYYICNLSHAWDLSHAWEQWWRVLKLLQPT